jgi:hypothetical protein
VLEGARGAARSGGGSGGGSSSGGGGGGYGGVTGASSMYDMDSDPVCLGSHKRACT